MLKSNFLFLCSTSFLIPYKERQEEERWLDLGAPSLRTILPHTWEARGDGREPVGSRSSADGLERGRMGLVEGKGGRRMPYDAFRDPYALLTQANDTNDYDWLRNWSKWVSLLSSRTHEICFKMLMICVCKTLF